MTGAVTFLRHFLRRDRWMLLVWVLGGALLYVSQAIQVEGTYATQADLDKAAASMAHNAAFIAMLGPARALDTIGGQVAWQASAFGAILAGLMSMFLVGRHTRVEEETGRDELLRASPVGRLAPTTAALVTALLANVLLGVAVSLTLIAYRLGVPDSVALGAGLTLSGWVFTGTALLAAQLTASARSMYGIAGAIMGVAYALRAVGDLRNSALAWLSPIGWYQGMHAFSGLRWWPALLLLAGAAAVTAAAYVLFQHRDFGAGLLAARPGPARAAPRLRTGWGLAWQLQRGSVLGWALALLLFAAAFGAVGNDVTDVIGTSKASQDIFVQSPGDLIDSFYATAILMLAVIASAFAISSALRPRGEEDDGRVEPLLATALSRRRWLLAQIGTTAVGCLLVLLAAGVGLGAGYAAVTGDTHALITYPPAALPYIAPMLVLSGLTRLLYGVAPRAATLAWLALGFCVVVLLFGQLFHFPQWLLNLSPFQHLALTPAQDFTWAPFLGLLTVAALLSAAGQLAFQHRDVH